MIPETVTDLSVLARVVLATAPTGIVATPVSATQINLTWIPVVGAVFYRVYRNGTLVETTEGTSHSSIGLTASTLYSFQLSSVGEGDQEGPASSTVTATTFAAPDLTPPTVPVISVATNSASTQIVTLVTPSTDAGTGLASYNLDRATNSGFTANLVTTSISPSSFPANISGLSSSTQYFYRCRAVDGASNQSANSAAVNATTSASGNQPPVWAPLADQFFVVGTPFNLSLDALCSDPEGQPVTYTIESGTLPTGLSQSGTRGQTISGTPTDAASASVTFLASDSAVDAEADWTARSTAPGVFFKNNFNFASTAALKASNYGGSGVPSSDRMELETVNVLSGKGCKINVLKNDGEGTGSYRHDWNAVGSQNKGAPKKELYYQYAVYLPKYILDHRFKTLNNAKKNHKWAIIQEPDQSFGRGEVVVITPFFRKCVGAYRIMGSGPLNTWRDVSGTPANPNTPDHAFQTIDAGPQSEGGLTDATSQSLFERRYGFFDQHMSGTTTYGGGTLEAQGQPDPDGAVNGIVWVEDAYNVVEVYVNEATDTVKVWHAEYGDPPRLVINAVGTADLGNRAGNYTGAQLLPRLEEREGDAGREDTYAIYGELLGSSSLIKFPGGFTPI